MDVNRSTDTSGPDRSEGGFSLIELLVVIIIIGILAAFATMIFLGQRQKGYDAQAKNDLRHLATLEETYLIDNAGYAPSVAMLTAGGLTFKASPQAVTTVNGVTAGVGYCLRSVSASGRTFWFSSTSGGLTSTACTTS